MTRARGLGRGLSALIPSKPGVDEVDVDLIVPNPQQPRTVMDEGALNELVESVREHGVIQPLLVSEGEQPGVYQLIAGERRLRAARLAGLQRVPVVVKEAASGELLELALVENLQREDLNALEEALAYRRLADEFDMTQEAIATRVGRSRTAVANAMRLLALSDEVKASLASGEMTEGHARALLGLEDPGVRRRVWREVVDRGLSVRETEALVRRGGPTTKAPASRAPAASDPDVSRLEERLRTALGTKVELHQRARGRGRLVVHFYSDEELEGLLARLGVQVD
ncbi:MAG: ParB/RepB/Spo0J family partition protein [Dehalococcoidia bacterium]